jgi:hypothetical protein
VSAKQKSQRGFVAVTLITLLAITLIIVVYAAILGTFTGGNVQVVAVKGTVYYSLDNSTNSADWSKTLTDVPINGSWYALFNVTGTGGYSGSVDIRWDLRTNSTVIIQTVPTSVYLTGNAQLIYASSYGLQQANYNWGQNTLVANTYYIVVTVTTP